MTEKDVLPMIEAILPLLPETFVGRIEFNVFLGAVTNVNVEQSFKRKGTSPGIISGAYRQKGNHVAAI